MQSTVYFSQGKHQIKTAGGACLNVTYNNKDGIVGAEYNGIETMQCNTINDMSFIRIENEIFIFTQIIRGKGNHTIQTKRGNKYLTDVKDGSVDVTKIGSTLTNVISNPDDDGIIHLIIDNERFLFKP
jgi:hypothetical protein